jgi:cytochrome c nitrite reductase small subunit
LVKAEIGWRHGKLFTTQTFREPIVVQAAGRRVLQENCLRCHAEVTADMHTDGVACTHCHASVGHGERAGLGGPLHAEEIRALEQAAARPNP